jgi:hypothetical protein
MVALTLHLALQQLSDTSITTSASDTPQHIHDPCNSGSVGVRCWRPTVKQTKIFGFQGMQRLSRSTGCSGFPHHCPKMVSLKPLDIVQPVLITLLTKITQTELMIVSTLASCAEATPCTRPTARLHCVALELDTHKHSTV